MNRPMVVALLVVTIGCGSRGPGPVDSLVEAERAFAADAAERGIPTAFLAVLADDAVVFTPDAVPGRERYEAMPDGLARLSWEPRVAEASIAGDLGFTTGPFTFRASPEEPPLHGHYLSVWHRADGQGPWRLITDIGTPHDPVDPEPFSFRDARGSRGRGAAEGGAESLVDADAPPVTLDLDPIEVCRASAAPDYRFLYPDRPPAIGVAPACAARSDLLASTRAVGRAGRVSVTGDLGFTRGVLRDASLPGDPETHVYVRVWRHRPDGWQRVAEVVLPLPPETAADTTEP